MVHCGEPYSLTKLLKLASNCDSVSAVGVGLRWVSGGWRRKALWRGDGMGREADFSTALLTKA